MGRYDFRPIRVLQHANQLLETGRVSHRPPWHSIVAQIPPGETIVRPVKRFEPESTGRRRSRNKRSSRMFQPLQIVYPEDKLRSTFFGDHPWELARPRTVVEADGNDGKTWDWSRMQQPRKAMDGESVVRRQLWLLNDHKRKLYEARRLLAGRLSDEELEADAYRTARKEVEEADMSLSPANITSRKNEIIQEYTMKLDNAERLLAERMDEQTLEELTYDQARKEFYEFRLRQDVERQVAKEEALHYGAYFEQTANEKAMKFEDDAFEDWRTWALKDIELFKHKNSSMLTGSGANSDDDDGVPVLDSNEDAKMLTS